jgi:hypothetical protein
LRAQQPQPLPAPPPPPKQATVPVQKQTPPVIDQEDVVRITTNLVQVDAVVTKDEKQVTDLKAEDFEILEDGHPRTITNFAYISNIVAGARPTSIAARKDIDKDAPPIPVAPRIKLICNESMQAECCNLEMVFSPANTYCRSSSLTRWQKRSIVRRHSGSISRL